MLYILFLIQLIIVNNNIIYFDIINSNIIYIIYFPKANRIYNNKKNVPIIKLLDRDIKKQLNLSNLIFYFLGKSNKNINTLQKKIFCKVWDLNPRVLSTNDLKSLPLDRSGNLAIHNF